MTSEKPKKVLKYNKANDFKPLTNETIQLSDYLLEIKVETIKEGNK